MLLRTDTKFVFLHAGVFERYHAGMLLSCASSLPDTVNHAWTFRVP